MANILCATFSNVPIGCQDKQSGGIKTVYICEYAALSSVTVTTGVSGGTVSGITMQSGSQFYTYNFIKQSGSYTEPSAVSTENNTVYYKPEISLQFSKLEVVKRNTFKALSQTDVTAIVLTNAGKYWLVGSGNGLTLSAGSSDAGKGFGDFNGYKFTLSGEENDLAYELPANLLPALLVAAP